MSLIDVAIIYYALGLITAIVVILGSIADGYFSELARVRGYGYVIGSAIMVVLFYPILYGGYLVFYNIERQRER